MKNNLLKNSGVALIVTLLAISPVFAYAKNNDNDKGNSDKSKKTLAQVKVERENDNDDDNEDRDKKENKSDKKCRVAYGHLFAFGWLKKDNKIEIDGDCFLPFGIAKKFRDRNNNASSTPDTAAPVITNLSAQTKTNSAVLSWNTNEKADSTVFWSLTSPVSTATTSTNQKSVGTKIKNHSIEIGGLAASTTYFAIVRSKDPAGNTATSSEISFTTKSPVVVGDVTAPTIHSVVAVVGTSTAKIGWQTNEPATTKVYYSTSTPLSLTASSTMFVESVSLTLPHLIQINGLATSTTYHSVVESKDASGNTQRSTEFSFTTGS